MHHYRFELSDLQITKLRELSTGKGLGKTLQTEFIWASIKPNRPYDSTIGRKIGSHLRTMGWFKVPCQDAWTHGCKNIWKQQLKEFMKKATFKEYTLIDIWSTINPRYGEYPRFCRIAGPILCVEGWRRKRKTDALYYLNPKYVEPVNIDKLEIQPEGDFQL